MIPRQTKWWGAADLLGGLLLLVMSVLVLISVIGRTVPALRVANVDQMLPDMLVWVAMLGTAAAVRRNEHLGISLLADKAPRPVRRVLGAIVLVAAAIYFGSLVYRGAVQFMFDLDRNLNGPAGYPVWLVTLALPAGALLCVVYLLVRGYWLVRGVEDDTPAKAVL